MTHFLNPFNVMNPSGETLKQNLGSDWTNCDSWVMHFFFINTTKQAAKRLACSIIETQTRNNQNMHHANKTICVFF